MDAPTTSCAKLRATNINWVIFSCLIVAVLLPFCGCKMAAKNNRGTVSESVESRFGVGLGPSERLERVIIPAGFELGQQPLAEEQAVMLALWNNAAFREALVELDLTRADLIQAGLLPNPDFAYNWPVPDKVFNYLAEFPLESLLFRPFKLKVAAAENDRAGAKLTQLALDLIRDTRQAYSDLQLANDRLRVAEKALAIREEILKLAETRLKAGDASPLEASTARIDAIRAAQDLTPLQHEITVAQEKLRALMGLSDNPFPIIPENTVFDPRTEHSAEELVAAAVAARPDLAAVQSATSAAAEKLRLSRMAWVHVLGIADATSGLKIDHELGPGFKLSVPIFNQGQGGIARAKSEFDQLELRQQTLHNQVILDVRTAFARYRQARDELDFLRKKTRPEVEANLRRADSAYKEGNATYLIVLETTRLMIETYIREAQLSADLRRAWAELERGVSRRLSTLPPKPEP
jgi:cobalt-zinc-cadmium efflux system outer membrane protein